ncbi:MAG TPA: YitT family protein [Chlamydiales bacterium]|nr:YitT family protein [Chlamydiales bacterium]
MVKLKPKPLRTIILNNIGIALGTFLAAISIRVFLYPNALIDGGVIGISLIMGRVFGDNYISLFLILINAPFIYLAYKHIRKSFVIQMMMAVAFFALFLTLTKDVPHFHGEAIEIIVIGGALLGLGVGLMIKYGGCTDGTEIMAIILNRRLGFTVGQIVLFINIFIFTAYGWIFSDWHSALKSLMAYTVAFKMIDIVIAGLDEVKSVLIVTTNPKKVKSLIMHELGLGLTIIPSIGGFSGENKEILFVIVERLDLADLKGLVLREDPKAFIVVENLLEVAYGKEISKISQKRKKRNRRKDLTTDSE